MSEGRGRDDGQCTARLPFPPVVMGIAGASGSGKTTLAVELARTLGGTPFSSRQLLSRSFAFAA